MLVVLCLFWCASMGLLVAVCKVVFVRVCVGWFVCAGLSCVAFDCVLVVVCLFWCAGEGLLVTVCRLVFEEYVVDGLFVLV